MQPGAGDHRHPHPERPLLPPQRFVQRWPEQQKLELAEWKGLPCSSSEPDLSGETRSVASSCGEVEAVTVSSLYAGARAGQVWIPYDEARAVPGPSLRQAEYPSGTWPSPGIAAAAARLAESEPATRFYPTSMAWQPTRLESAWAKEPTSSSQPDYGERIPPAEPDFPR